MDVETLVTQWRTHELRRANATIPDFEARLLAEHDFGPLWQTNASTEGSRVMRNTAKGEKVINKNTTGTRISSGPNIDGPVDSDGRRHSALGALSPDRYQESYRLWKELPGVARIEIRDLEQ